MVAFGEYEGDDTASTIKARDHKDATDLVAFSCKNYLNDVMEDCAPALRAMNSANGRDNGGGQIAVAFKPAHYTRGKDGAPIDLAFTLTAEADKGDSEALVLTAGFKGGQGTGSLGYEEETAPTITADAGHYAHSVVYENHMQDSRVRAVDVCPTLSAKAGTGGGNLPLVQNSLMVRRLTPRECERLQGFPDDYTLIPIGRKGKLAADSPRYKAMGNSMAVPVMRWIGERIQQFEESMEGT